MDDVGQLRYAAGEQCARAMAATDSFKELVAVLWWSTYNGYIWTDLRNVAEDQQHRFDVDGEQVMALLKRVREAGGRIVALWHTHQDQSEPSSTDVESFPSWLCDTGAIWCASAETLVLYNGSGVISRFEALDSVSTKADQGNGLATEDKSS